LNENATELVASFVNNYLKDYKFNQHASKFKDFIAVDLLFNVSINDFTEKVLTAIQQDELLNSRYQYFYRSPTKYHRVYKYNYTVVFACSNNEIELEILSAVKIIVLTLSKTNLFTYQLPLAPENELVNFNKSLCKLYQTALKNNIVKQTAILLIHLLSKQLQLDITDLVNLNKILVQKWILNRAEQKDIKQHSDIIRVQKINSKY